MSGIPKIEKTEISKFQKIILPMMRKVSPGLIASQLVGVQPMTSPSGQIFKVGLGPPVCGFCMVVGSLTSGRAPWFCPVCRTEDLKKHLFDFPEKEHTNLYNRGTLYRNVEELNFPEMKNPKIVYRPFMRKGDPEPNIKYRPWLEENIGKQGEEWHWSIDNTNPDTLRVSFLKSEDVVLFELTWQ